MRGLRYRDGQPSSWQIPVQGEERAALPLDRDRLLDERCIHPPIEVDHQPARFALSQTRTRSNASIALQLLTQSGLVECTAWRHRQRVHNDSLDSADNEALLAGIVESDRQHECAEAIGSRRR
jgi:hypothetical protein